MLPTAAAHAVLEPNTAANMVHKHNVNLEQFPGQPGSKRREALEGNCRQPAAEDDFPDKDKAGHGRKPIDIERRPQHTAQQGNAALPRSP